MGMQESAEVVVAVVQGGEGPNSQTGNCAETSWRVWVP